MKKRCIITAATSGLGRVLAKIFANNNFDLLLHARNEKSLVELGDSLATQANVELYHGDLRDDKVLDKLAGLISGGNFSVLVNNAGEGCPGLPLEDLSEEQIRTQIQVNFYVPLILGKQMMAHKDSAVINMNSIMALEPKANRSVYSGVRAGLMGFTEAMYSEALDKGVRFIGVYPSRIRTRPEYDFGMETEEVGQKIFNFYRNEKGSRLVLDGRPPGIKKG